MTHRRGYGAAARAGLNQVWQRSALVQPRAKLPRGRRPKGWSRLHRQCAAGGLGANEHAWALFPFRLQHDFDHALSFAEDLGFVKPTRPLSQPETANPHQRASLSHDGALLHGRGRRLLDGDP